MIDNSANAPEAWLALLSAAQRHVVTHPLAAQSLFGALVRQGRDFAATEEGSTLREGLLRSELIRRGRVVWEGVTLNMLTERPDPDEALPTAILDAFVHAAGRGDLERQLGRLDLTMSTSPDE